MYFLLYMSKKNRKFATILNGQDRGFDKTSLKPR